MLRAILRAFGRSSAGQDLAEYCMVTALVALIGLAVFIHISGGVQAIWGTANTALATGSATTTGAGAAATTSSAPVNPRH